MYSAGLVGPLPLAREAPQAGQVSRPLLTKPQAGQGFKRRCSNCQPTKPTTPKIKGSTNTGQQEQFYLEGQITYAVPKEDGQLPLYVSTQHPDGNQREAAHALNLHTNDVEVI